MSNIIPLDGDRKHVKKDIGFDFLNKISGFSLNQNSLIALLPILFIFLTTQNSAGFNINKFFNDKGLGGIFSKFKLSSDNISKSLKTLNSIKPHVNDSPLIGTISFALEAMYAFTTFQELTSHLSFLSNSPLANTRGKRKNTEKKENNNSKEVNFKILEALSELLTDDIKPIVKQGMDMLRTMTLFQDMNTVMGRSNKNPEGLDISNLINLLSPLLSQQDGLNNMKDIKKIIEIFTAMNGNDLNKNYKNKESLNKKKFNKENVIDIEEYDEEEDIIDELLDDLMDY